ncbi:MAG: hypothetical protein ACPGGB_11195 [Flavobacteriales bacterium]
MPRYPSDTAAPVTVTPKDPDSVIDYLFDFAPLTNGRDPNGSDWLSSGESIASHVIEADSGITVDSSVAADSNRSVRVWLSGGTVGETYTVTCRITTDTSPARVEDRSASISVAEK